MKISIIVAVYNGAPTLQMCLDSINRQTFKNFELIVMDGGSIDGSVDILRNNSDLISYWESKPDGGIYHAWNKALDHVTGDWIYFLGADDMFHDESALERFAKKINRNVTDPILAYGKVVFCDGTKRRVIGEEWNKIKHQMKSGMCIPHQGLFHNKLLFEKYGKFDERYQIAGDYLLILRGLQYGPPVFFGDIITDQHAGGKSSVRSLRWKVLKEFRMAQKEMGWSPTFSWIFAYIKAQIWRLVG